MMNGQDILECVFGTEIDNMYLCPCSPELSGVEAELYNAENREKNFGTLWKKPARSSIIF